RPPFFTAEYERQQRRDTVTRLAGFNEAAVLHGGIPGTTCAPDRRAPHASTRPPFFTAEYTMPSSWDPRADGTLQRGRRSSRRNTLTSLATDDLSTLASTRPPFFTAEYSPSSAPITSGPGLQRGRRSSRRSTPTCYLRSSPMLPRTLQRGRRSSRRNTRRHARSRIVRVPFQRSRRSPG